MLPLVCGLWASIPYDFFIKILNKANLHDDNTDPLPIPNTKYIDEIMIRSLRLNCLTAFYSELWQKLWKDDYRTMGWAKSDGRLSSESYVSLSKTWTFNSPIRSDYERRETLIELDVLAAMSLGMTLDQLITIYRIQFPILQQYEDDTWYDTKGRIVFTNNRSLIGVGVDRSTWEHEMKGACAGTEFANAMNPSIKYYAPFDKCNREKDYELVWHHFEKTII